MIDFTITSIYTTRNSSEILVYCDHYSKRMTGIVQPGATVHIKGVSSNVNGIPSSLVNGTRTVVRTSSTAADTNGFYIDVGIPSPLPSGRLVLPGGATAAFEIPNPPTPPHPSLSPSRVTSISIAQGIYQATFNLQEPLATSADKGWAVKVSGVSGATYGIPASELNGLHRIEHVTRNDTHMMSFAIPVYTTTTLPWPQTFGSRTLYCDVVIYNENETIMKDQSEQGDQGVEGDPGERNENEGMSDSTSASSAGPETSNVTLSWWSEWLRLIALAILGVVFIGIAFWAKRL